MERYRLISPELQGSIVFGYDEVSGQLKEVQLDCELKPEQVKFMSGFFPIHIDSLGYLAGKKGRIEAVEPDLSFGNFWSTYAYKVGNKAKAEKLWNALKDSDRQAVFSAIPKLNYFSKAKGIEKPYPTTFLAQQRWDNDFNVNS